MCIRDRCVTVREGVDGALAHRKRLRPQLTSGRVVRVVRTPPRDGEFAAEGGGFMAGWGGQRRRRRRQRRDRPPPTGWRSGVTRLGGG
eukprot:1082076-Pyramimonas_sp.AAC.1